MHPPRTILIVVKDQDSFLNFAGSFLHGPIGFTSVVSLWAEKANGTEMEARGLQLCFFLLLQLDRRCSTAQSRADGVEGLKQDA